MKVSFNFNLFCQNNIFLLFDKKLNKFKLKVTNDITIWTRDRNQIFKKIIIPQLEIRTNALVNVTFPNDFQNYNLYERNEICPNFYWGETPLNNGRIDATQIHKKIFTGPLENHPDCPESKNKYQRVWGILRAGQKPSVNRCTHSILSSHFWTFVRRYVVLG